MQQMVKGETEKRDRMNIHVYWGNARPVILFTRLPVILNERLNCIQSFSTANDKRDWKTSNK